MKKVYLEKFLVAFLFVCLVVIMGFIVLCSNNYQSAVYATSGSTDEKDGKKIANHELLENMTVHPEHDQKNGCGLVAMGVLLQFYNDLETQYQGQYIPVDTMNYKKANGEDQILYANNLRDTLDPLTPKLLDSWFGLENATVPGGQAKGLEAYLKNYCPDVNANVYHNELAPHKNITDLLDKDIPVLLTILTYDHYYYDGRLRNENDKGKPHVVVAYGYKYVDGKIHYLAHFGWGSKSTKYWVSATSKGAGEFLYGYCYIDAPLSRFDITKSQDGQSVKINGLKYSHSGLLTIPHTYDNIPVTEIGENAFLNQSGITDIRFEAGKSSLQTIGNYAFSGTNIPWIELPDTVTSIGKGAFKDCIKLSKIWSLSNVQSIGDEAFKGCNALNSVSMLNNIQSIGNEAFKDCVALNSVTSLDKIQNIGNGAFNGCLALNTVLSLDKIKSIGNEAFKDCYNLPQIFISSELTNIGECAFLNCNKLDISVSSNNPNFSAVGNLLFNKTKTSIIASGKVPLELTIPSSVTEILPYAFAGNTNVYSIIFKNSPEIGANAFAGCSNLTTVYFYANNVPSFIGENSFSNTNFTLYAPLKFKEEFTAEFANYTDSIEPIRVQIYLISDKAKIGTLDVYYGSAIENLPVPTKTGYEFCGWYSDEAFESTPYQNGDICLETENIILYAKWQAKQCSVTLDANGGTISGDTTFDVFYDDTFSTTADISRTGYTFEGWYDIDGVKYMTASGESCRLWDKVTDTTLFAQWAVKSYEIQINDNGTITWLGASGLSDVKCSIEYGTILNAINLIASFKQSDQGFKEGKIFDHFECENEVVNWSAVPDFGENGKIVTIIPIWIFEWHTIYFNTQTDIMVNKIEAYYDSEIQLPNVNREGYLLEYWHKEDSNTAVNWLKMPDLTPDKQSDGSIVLFANWKQISFTVTFDKNGGIGGSDKVVATIGFKMPYAEKPTLLGHTFMGYFLEIDGQEIQYYTSNMESAHLWDIARDETLKAKWEANQYKITIDYNDGSGRTKDIDVIFGKEIELLPYAPERLGFSFDGAYASPNGVGKKYFYSNDIVYDNDRNDYFENFVSFIEVWDEPASRTIYANWEPYSMDIYPEFYCHGDWSSQKEYRITTNEILKLTPLDKAGYTFKSWLILEYDPDNNWNLGQNTTISYNNKISYTMQVFLDYGKLASRYQFVAEYTKNPVEEDTCVAEGTLITLSDGTQKAVEDLTGSEQLLVWNLFTGTFDTAPILFIDHDPAREYEVINLAFSDETTVKVISEHGFWDFDLNEYVFLRRDAAKYIGHWFNKQTTDAEGKLGWTKVQLVNVTIQKEVTTAWSPVTYGHLCYYVNGMLSMPGATEGLINIFDVDPNTLKIDEAKYNADIAEYGLYTYEEFAETYPVPEVIFEAFGGKYLKVSIGKGLIDSETLGRLIERYSKFFV